MANQKKAFYEERTGLEWLVRARLVVLIGVLGMELAIHRITGLPLPMGWIVVVISAGLAVAVLDFCLLHCSRAYRGQALWQVFSDLLMITVAVHFTGGVDSTLNFLYPVVIIVACMILPRAWGFSVAGLAFIFYGTLLELNYYGLVVSYASSHPRLESLRVIIFGNLIGFLAIAYLAGRLTAKLHQTSATLHDTRGVLANLQALHENIIHSMTGGVIATSPEGRITLVNRSMQLLLECGAAELEGQPVGLLFNHPLFRASEPEDGEISFRTKRGYHKSFRVTSSALVEGEAGGVVYTFEDLTEVRRLERDVRIQDRLAAVGRLAAALAHEIRNPLTAIAGSVELLSGLPTLTSEHRKLLQIVMRESVRLNRILTEFLAYSREKRYRFERVDLVALLEDTLALIEQQTLAQPPDQPKIQVSRKFSVAHAWVLGDGDRIKQVFWNFGENALRAMRNGGTLNVSLTAMHGEWELTFADTGPGMTPQQTEKIFEPFQSGFEGGTGLGLAIVYQIVQAHEGRVWARSQPGRGTTFVLRLRQAEELARLMEPVAPLALCAAAGASHG